ncbi:apoptosis-inducing factor 3 isoform X2 [Chelonus insularis]|nr:apoptosis-inducing factor 3 isoform X2 [Chelonus insularis]XP_034936699.1 apoptosis-inducing factor 3 isoform X2 [Chelonus insularis]
MCDNEFIEDVVCNETDINENEMKLLPLGEEGQKILLIKQKGQLHAIGTKCSHYGALLHTGALGDGRVRCPWHGACFNIKTGDIEDFPGLDSLPCYKVSIENGSIKVRAKKTELETNKRIRGLTFSLKETDPTVVIVGGGPAAATCADTLRQEGFAGRIIVIAAESVLPYDRVKVSKAMDFDVEKSALRSQDYWNQRMVEIKLNATAQSLDTSKKIVVLTNNEEIKYTYLFAATGSKATFPNGPDLSLNNIFFLRDHKDAANIHKTLAPEKNVVIIGQGFISMESAAYCVGKCNSITVVGKGKIPLSTVFGDVIGERLKKEHESKNVVFINGTTVKKFINAENSNDVKEVELENGVILPADIVICGTGSTPNSDWLKTSNININNDHSVSVDKFLKTNVDGVFAGGDLACAPVFINNDEPAVIGHYGLAHYHGKIAALNICGKETPLRAVPYFWTSLFGKSIRYAGFGRPTSIKIHGSVEDYKFFAYYFKNGKVIAMSSAGTDPIVSDFAEFLYEGKTLTEKEVQENPTGWMRNKPKEALKTIFPEKFSSGTQVFRTQFGIEHKKNYHTLAYKRPINNEMRIINILTNAILKYSKYFPR